MADGAEQPLHRGEHVRLGAALPDLADEGAAGRQHLAGEPERRLQQRHDPQVVGAGVSGRGWRHVAEHDIGLARERVADQRRRRLVEEVGAQHLRPRDGPHFQQVEREHAAAAGLPGANAFDRDLSPSPRRGAQIDDARARPQQPEAVVQLDQLERGARTKAAALGFRDVGIGELPLQPAAGGRRPLPAALQPATARPPGKSSPAEAGQCRAQARGAHDRRRRPMPMPPRRRSGRLVRHTHAQPAPPFPPRSPSCPVSRFTTEPAPRRNFPLAPEGSTPGASPGDHVT